MKFIIPVFLFTLISLSVDAITLTLPATDGNRDIILT